MHVTNNHTSKTRKSSFFLKHAIATVKAKHQFFIFRTFITLHSSMTFAVNKAKTLDLIIIVKGSILNGYT